MRPTLSIGLTFYAPLCPPVAFKDWGYTIRWVREKYIPFLVVADHAPCVLGRGLVRFELDKEEKLILRLLTILDPPSPGFSLPLAEGQPLLCTLFNNRLSEPRARIWSKEPRTLLSPASIAALRERYLV